MAGAGQVRRTSRRTRPRRRLQDPARQALSASLACGPWQRPRSWSSAPACSAPRWHAIARWPAGTSRWSSAWRPGTCAPGSGDESRLIRCCHGADAWHTRSARRALGAVARDRPGARRARRASRGSRAATTAGRRRRGRLRALGIPCERVDADRAVPQHRARRPALHAVGARGGHPARPRGGAGRWPRRRWRPARACRARRAPDGAAVAPRRRPARSRPTASSGRAARGCRRSSPACSTCASPTRTSSTSARRRLATPGVPGWVDYDGAAYGLGDLDGRGVKVAPDVEGPPCDPETRRARRRARARALARAYVAASLPRAGRRAARRAPRLPVRADRRHALRGGAAPRARRRVWLLGGGSGHGFKHGPALAERFGRGCGAAEPEPRFGLGARTGDMSLRTAGVRTHL